MPKKIRPPTSYAVDIDDEEYWDTFPPDEDEAEWDEEAQELAA